MKTLEQAISEIKFVEFNNKDKYAGSTKNIIFFTYNDHYYYNSAMWMSVSKLGHAHEYPDDRGYIKGVATDLNGYVSLKFIKEFFNNDEANALLKELTGCSLLHYLREI